MKETIIDYFSRKDRDKGLIGAKLRLALEKPVFVTLGNSPPPHSLCRVIATTEIRVRETIFPGLGEEEEKLLRHKEKLQTPKLAFSQQAQQPPREPTDQYHG